MEKKREENILISGANVWTGKDFRKLDVKVDNGRITAVGEALTASGATRLIDGEGLHLLPGLVDLHVHFREPGFSYKETIRTGSEAAAAGGFTTVCSMPNLNPAPDSVENLSRQLDLIEKEAVINVIPYATITMNRLGGECVDFKALASDTAGFSDDGSGVQSEDVMRQAMRAIAPTGKMLAAHCEVNSLLNGGYIHAGEYAAANGHRGICSESEWKEVERDIRLSEETGCRLHICHVSTKESVELVRDAKKRGLKVTCETGPHYLAFCDEDMREEGRFKMNPPLRSLADMEALREGVADGTIDAVATDHAPHSAEEKSKGLEKSAMGVVGLETSLAAVNTYMVRPGRMPLSRLVEAMSERPAQLIGIEHGIEPGKPANLILVDFDKEFIVDPSKFLSKGKSTPFEGERLFGEVLLTICEGKIVNDKMK